MACTQCIDVACCYWCSVGVVCMSVGHNGELYKNGWTSWGAIWSVDAGGTSETRIRWIPGSPIGRAYFGYISQPTVMNREYLACSWYSEPYFVGDSSDVAFGSQYCSNFFCCSYLLCAQWPPGVQASIINQATGYASQHYSSPVPSQDKLGRLWQKGHSA